MELSLQSFSTLVRNMSASAQASCASLTDLTAGSVTRALIEASASAALWVQYLVLQVMSMTRLATSSGLDVDSWVNDFGLTRLPGTAAIGTVTFSSLSPASLSAVIPVGASVRTADGSQTFSVIIDALNPAWSTLTYAYVRPVGTASVDLPVQANVVGSAGNVQANTINLLGQTITGIDTCNNAAPFTTGVDAETDAALKARFVNYINTRARATIAAIGNAIESVQQDLTYAIEENVDPSGAARPGFFTAVVDDGTGSPPAALLLSVSAAIDAVRPVGTGYAVVGPQVLLVQVALTLTVLGGADATTVADNVQTTIAAFVDALSVGAVLPYSRIASLAYGADPSVANVSGVTVNGGTSDVGGLATQVVRLKSVSAS